MPPEGDAATMSPQRCIAMPSPAWSRRSRRRDLVSLDQDKKSAGVALGPIVHKKSTVPLDQLSAISSTLVPLDLLSSRSSVLLDHLSSRSLSRDEARVKVQETIAMVDRWYDSDDWKPWTPPTPEEELRMLDDPSAPRPEIIANEERHRQLSVLKSLPLRQ